MAKRLKVIEPSKTDPQLLELLKGVNWLKTGEAAVEVIDRDGNKCWKRVLLNWHQVSGPKPPKRKPA